MGGFVLAYQELPGGMHAWMIYPNVTPIAETPVWTQKPKPELMVDTDGVEFTHQPSEQYIRSHCEFSTNAGPDGTHSQVQVGGCSLIADPLYASILDALVKLVEQ